MKLEQKILQKDDLRQVESWYLFTLVMFGLGILIFRLIMLIINGIAKLFKWVFTKIDNWIEVRNNASKSKSNRKVREHR